MLCQEVTPVVCVACPLCLFYSKWKLFFGKRVATWMMMMMIINEAFLHADTDIHVTGRRC